MLADGYRVVLAGRRESQLLETGAGHAQALAVPCDVTVPDDVERLFAETLKMWGRVDVLFNNAGVFGPAASVDEISLADWDATVSVNLTGSMLCAAAAVRAMKAQSPQGGRIINNGSIAAHSPRPRTVAYTVTKHAMTGLTKSIELDGRGFGITCGQIDIGNTATELMDTIGVGSGAVQADGSSRVEPTFPVDDAARAVLLMAGMPPSASVGSLVITAAGMPFIGRGLAEAPARSERQQAGQVGAQPRGGHPAGVDGVCPAQLTADHRQPGGGVALNDVRGSAAGMPRTLHALRHAERRDPHFHRVSGRPGGDFLQGVAHRRRERAAGDGGAGSGAAAPPVRPGALAPASAQGRAALFEGYPASGYGHGSVEQRRDGVAQPDLAHRPAAAEHGGDHLVQDAGHLRDVDGAGRGQQGQARRAWWPGCCRRGP